MSDQIMPIQSDSTGLTTFQKIKTLEVPDASPASTRPASTGGKSTSGGDLSDTLTFSRPVKKHIETKITYFTAQMPALAAQPQLLDKLQAYFKKQVDQIEDKIRKQREAERPEDSYITRIEKALEAFQKRLEKAQGLSDQPGLQNQQPQLRVFGQKPPQPGQMLNLIR